MMWKLVASSISLEYSRVEPLIHKVGGYQVSWATQLHAIVLVVEARDAHCPKPPQAPTHLPRDAREATQ